MKRNTARFDRFMAGKNNRVCADSLLRLGAIKTESHAVTTGIPHDIESPANEWTIWKPNPRSSNKVRILATLDPSNYPMGFKYVLSSGDLPLVGTRSSHLLVASKVKCSSAALSLKAFTASRAN